MLYRGDNRIQAHSHQEPPVFGLGSSFGELHLSEGNLEFANHLLGTSVRLQVEHKQLIGNGHLIGSSLR